MAHYTLRKFTGGGEADGKLEICDDSHPATPYVLHAHGYTPGRVSVYNYEGDEQDGNVTLRVYAFVGDKPIAEAHDFARRLSDGSDPDSAEDDR